MAKDLLKVELIENPSVTRLMTVASYQNNTHKWRIAGAIEATKTPTPEKKSAEPVAVVDSPFVSPTQTSEFVADPAVPQDVAADPAPTGVIDGMRAQYKAVSGKDADGRWGVKKLSEEIKKLETPA